MSIFYVYIREIAFLGHSLEVRLRRCVAYVFFVAGPPAGSGKSTLLCGNPSGGNQPGRVPGSQADPPRNEEL